MFTDGSALVYASKSYGQTIKPVVKTSPNV